VITLQSLAAELAITVTDGAVWLAIAQGLLFGGACLVFGVWVARLVGLLGSRAPAGETFAVGLASGLIVLGAWWAAIWSGGRSSFTPVAIGFAIAIVLALIRRVRGSADAGSARLERPARGYRSMILTTLAAGAFVVVVGLLYGSTMAPSQRDGVQPVENRDEAYYAVLGRDLATTGTESNLSPSGFSNIPGIPPQTWYHWGERWLASAAITIFGAEPLAARFFIVLPIVLLAAAALSGTVVRRVARTDSRWAYAFGFCASLFLAPVALIPGPFFSGWAVGMLFGITLYGLGAVSALLALYSLVVLGRRAASWALAIFVGSVIAFILPAHLAIAVLALVGAAGVVAIRIGGSFLSGRHLPEAPPIWARTLIAIGVAVISTVAWGMLTGHDTGATPSSATPASAVSPSNVVSPFNSSWRDSIAIIVLGAGVFFAIPIAWFLSRKDAPIPRDLYLGTMGLLVAGAIGWGARLADFTMFYLFFAGLAVFATVMAASAVRTLWDRLRTTGHRALAVGLVVLCFIQLELGGVSGIVRLQGFGPNGFGPIPTDLLGAIRQLPADARLAYSCGPFDEIGYGSPQLLSIDAHAGRRVVPMCFEAEFPNTLLGAEPSVEVMSQFFRGSPQSSLYPDAEARPSQAAVSSFLKGHDIGYIYADQKHPNSLVNDATVVASSGGVMVLKVP